ncbi:MAG: ABC transporter substrate-binding protein [Gemmobacter sp.]
MVSLNVCTDQLAMLLAAPGQLVAVSRLAADPRTSAMAREAAAFPRIAGHAEEVWLLRPDLVLAGTYTTRATVELLRRLGVPVQEFPPVSGLDAVADQMRAVGAALGRAAEAEAMAEAFETSVAALRHPGPPAAAAFYHPNGWTTGRGTLADDILTAAGFRNIAGSLGLSGGGYLPLETLVLAAPDLVVASEPWPGASRAEEILRHPVLRALHTTGRPLPATDADWICGTPHLLRAVAAMTAARDALDRR